jgi:hypothetical protein
MGVWGVDDVAAEWSRCPPSLPVANVVTGVAPTGL